MKSTLTLISFYFFHSLMSAQVSLNEFKTITQAFQNEYAAELKKQNAVIAINQPPNPTDPDFWWNLSTVRAAYSSTIDQGTRIHYIIVMGGFGKLQSMTPDGLAATICHELGHGISGPPFKNRNEDSSVSVEGQADYFAYQSCLPRIFKRLAPAMPIKIVSPFTDSLCKKHFSKPDDLQFCARSFQTLEVERMYLKYVSKGLVDTSFEKPDPQIVTDINLDESFYPSDQCRLDTMMAGLFQKKRPACWFK